MSARAIWQGVIHIGATRLPVKLYSAVVDREIHFHLLHAPDLVRLQQRMVLPNNEVVEREETRKGFPVDDETMLLLDDAELDRLAPAASRTIEVTRFIPRASLALEWLDRPYYLGPAPGHETECRAFAGALAKRAHCGIARWVMRKRDYVGAVFGAHGHLIALTLHSPDEVINTSQLSPPPGRDLSAEEQSLADQFVDSLTGAFEPGIYHDPYQDQIAQLVEAKRRGRKVPRRRASKRPEAPKSLAAALRRSVQAVKR
jgi:DNA end-binding protein Ku